MEQKVKPQMRKLEINITNNCSLECNNCDRCISVAKEPVACDMQIEQINKFIGESIALSYPWERIRIMGGEPTIHPSFQEIIRLLEEYKKTYNKHIILIVSTNGYSSVTKKVLEWLEKVYPDIVIENTKKTGNIQNHFYLFHVSPCDVDKGKGFKTYRGCWISEECGIGLSCSGYYCCAAGAEICRVFQKDIGIKSLSDMTFSKLTKMYSEICDKCGHYYALPITDDENPKQISETWQRALEKYQGNTLSFM